jgi:hypothetical protein
MNKLSAIIVDTFIMGTLTGDVFAELQTIFQNMAADMGATPIAHISVCALQILTDRGFVTTHYSYNGRADGIMPTDRAYSCMHLELANGWRCMEPRDAYDTRLVVDRPAWIEPASALGVSVNA